MLFALQARATNAGQANIICMKKIFILPLLVLLLIAVAGCSNQAYEVGNQPTLKNQPTKITSASQSKSNNDYPMSSASNVADKLEVYYFHATARCYSCKTIGQYVRETMEQKYAEQIKNGKIDYREINVDLPENKEVARKYQASGSSLFINRIKNGEDNIESDMNVWKLLGDETKFKSYLEDKINSYLNI
jgi:hypothetical protein